MADGSRIATSGRQKWPNKPYGRIWQNIAKNTVRQLITGYSQLLQERMDHGFDAYFLSFMFKPFTGSQKALLSQMNDEVQRVYSTLVTRVARNPRAESQTASLPFLITCPDRPVYKEKKQKLSDRKSTMGCTFMGSFACLGNLASRSTCQRILGRTRAYTGGIACSVSASSRFIRRT